jgi:hypothetical protein
MTRRPGPEHILLALVTLASIAAVWSVAWFPSQDGPAHVDSANVLRLYLQPAREDIRAQYRLLIEPVPNLTGQVLLGALLGVLAPATAEKVLLSAYLVLFPLAVRYAMPAAGGGAGLAALLALPFAWSRLFHWGFHNFGWGLVVLLVALGYWLRHRDRLHGGRWLGLLGMGLLLHFTHLGAVAPALFLIGTLAAWRLVVDAPDVGKAFRSALASALALMPAALLAWPYSQRQGEVLTAPADLAASLGRLLALDVLVSHSAKEAVVACLLAALCGVLLALALAWRWSQTRELADGLLLGAAGLALVYLLTQGPDARRLFLPERLAVLAPLVALLWLGTCSLPRGLRVGAAVVAAGLALAQVSLHAAAYRRLEPYVADYLSAGRVVGRGDTLLALSYAPTGFDRQGRPLSLHVAAFAHTSGFLAAEHGAIDLGNYQPLTRHFAIRFRRAGVRAAFDIGLREGTDSDPPFLDLQQYESATGRRVELLLLWGMRAADRAHPGWPLLEQTLERDFVQAHVSPLGLMSVYRRRATALGRATVAGEAGSR